MLLDSWIGELLDGLRERGTDERTLILVQGSDNGYLLRPSKKKMKEDGFRSSFFVSGHGVIPRGLLLPRMVNAVDIIPTLLDYAGAPVPW